MRRFRLRNVAGGLLGETHRTGTCGRRCDDTVSIIRNRYGKCAYIGLETCGSVWTCPVCASKIAARRATEIAELAAAHEAQGLPVYMVTFTVQHSVWDKAPDLREGMSTAWTKFNAGNPARRLRAAFSIAGYVRSLEVTRGRNGWHPHIHALLFVGDDLDEVKESELADRLFERWRSVCDRMGLKVVQDAFDFQRASNCESAASYISKWGAACEVAKGSEKLGRGSCSPWQLLDKAGRGDRSAGRLFLEYAFAFKGARHVTYSRGIREFYGLRDAAEDVELAREELMLEEADCSEVYRLDKGTWASVCTANLAGAVLDAADNGGAQGVHDFLCDAGICPSYERVPEHCRQWQPRSKFKQRKEEDQWNEKIPDGLWERRPKPDPETQHRWLAEVVKMQRAERLKRVPQQPLRQQMERLWLARGTKMQNVAILS